MSETFTEEVERELSRERGNLEELGKRRITIFFRLIALLIIGMLVVVGLAFNNVAVPWLFGLATVGGLVWVNHAIVYVRKQREN